MPCLRHKQGGEGVMHPAPPQSQSVTVLTDLVEHASVPAASGLLTRRAESTCVEWLGNGHIRDLVCGWHDGR